MAYRTPIRRRPMERKCTLSGRRRKEVAHAWAVETVCRCRPCCGGRCVQLREQPSLFSGLLAYPKEVVPCLLPKPSSSIRWPRCCCACWVFGFVLVTVWFGVYMLAGDFIYRFHGGMFDLSKHELDVIFYCGIGLAKLCVWVFFLIPWAAIRLVLRKTHGQCEKATEMQTT